jgi:hypothetical protein
VRKQTPAEERFRQQQQDRREAEQLHCQIGENGARKAKQVMDRLLGSVAE